MDTHGSDYLQLLNHSPLSVIVSDEKDQLIFANHHARETFGFDHQEAQSTNVRKFHSKHPESWIVIKQKAKMKETYAFESIAKKQTGGTQISRSSSGNISKSGNSGNLSLIPSPLWCLSKTRKTDLLP